MTPKGLSSMGPVAFQLPLYISNFKGGRGESFMYGVDRKTSMIDYDLKSAYTTGMCILDHPYYTRGKNLTLEELNEMDPSDILYSYLIVKATFKFPKNTKYPSIPVRADESTTVYPLEGACVLTGAELLCAYNQKCRIMVESAYVIPFYMRTKQKEHEEQDAAKLMSGNSGDLGRVIANLKREAFEDRQNTNLKRNDHDQKKLALAKNEDDLAFENKERSKDRSVMMKPFEGIIHHF